MRYQFESERGPVGAAQWEGPGQVSLDLEDATAKREFDRFFAREEVYLGSGYGDGEAGFQVRRRDWTPWEFERACRLFARSNGYRARRVPNAAVEQRPASA
ncbi:MAG: hypothetical protein ABR600_03480 [Actinomycetota bacterium]